MEIISDLPETFAALGNATRLGIVEHLLREGETAAGDLLTDGMSAPALSHHFKVLREAGIIVQRVDAQRRLYSVRPEAVRAIGEWTMTYRSFWEQSLDRLGQLITKETER